MFTPQLGMESSLPTSAFSSDLGSSQLVSSSDGNTRSGFGGSDSYLCREGNAVEMETSLPTSAFSSTLRSSQLASPSVTNTYSSSITDNSLQEAYTSNFSTRPLSPGLLHRQMSSADIGATPSFSSTICSLSSTYPWYMNKSRFDTNTTGSPCSTFNETETKTFDPHGHAYMERRVYGRPTRTQKMSKSDLLKVATSTNIHACSTYTHTTHTHTHMRAHINGWTHECIFPHAVQRLRSKEFRQFNVNWIDWNHTQDGPNALCRSSGPYTDQRRTYFAKIST